MLPKILFNAVQKGEGGGGQWKAELSEKNLGVRLQVDRELEG